jgi:excisionase family DNA binding protein
VTYAYTPETLAKAWEVSPSTVRTLVREGQLRAFRVGRQIRIRPDDV